MISEANAGKSPQAPDPGTRSSGKGEPVNERDPDRSPILGNRLTTVLTIRLSAIRTSLSGSPDSRFRVLMFGSSISMFGSRISTVAFPMLVLGLNHSPLITGLVAFAAIAPSMLVYIPAGVLVDRWNPRRVMLASEFLRGIAIASVVASLAAFGQHTSIWLLIIAMLSEEILEIFSTLADRRYLSGLMESDNMASRQAYIEVRAHAVVLAGRPIGPFLFTLNRLFPFVADAISFLFSVIILLALRISNEPVRPSQKLHLGQMRNDISQSFSWLCKDRRAWLTIVLMAVTSLVSQALIMMFLTEAHGRELSTISIGIVLAASGAGGAAGSICAKFLPSQIKGVSWLPIQMLAWGLALGALTLVGGLSPSWSAIAMLILGFTGAIGNIGFGTYLVESVGDDMLARVTSIGQMLAIGASAVGPALGGAAIQEYGAQRAVEILFFLVAMLACCSFFLPESTRVITYAPYSVARVLRIQWSTGLASVIARPMIANLRLAVARSIPRARHLASAILREEFQALPVGPFGWYPANFFESENSRPPSSMV